MEQTLLNYGIPFSLGFVLGVFVGFVVKNSVGKMHISEKRVIAFIVLAVWVVSVGADMIMSTYETPTMVHTIMGIVAGYFYDVDFLGIKNKK